MTLTNTVLYKLNVVLTALNDSQEIYQTCTREITNEEVKSWLNDLANKRHSMAMDLEHLVANFGHRPNQHGSLPGVIQRLWVNLKSMLVEATKESLLPTINRSEQALMATYHEVLAEPGIPEPLKMLLDHQVQEIGLELTALGNDTVQAQSIHYAPEAQRHTEAVIDATNKASFLASDPPEFIQPKVPVATKAATEAGTETVHDAGLTDQEAADVPTRRSHVREALQHSKESIE